MALCTETGSLASLPDFISGANPLQPSRLPFAFQCPNGWTQPAAPPLVNWPSYAWRFKSVMDKAFFGLVCLGPTSDALPATC